MSRPWHPTVPVVAAWSCLIAAFAVGMQQSCISGEDDDVALAVIALLLAGAVLAYAAIVVLVWPVRRSGDVPIMLGAAVTAVVGAPLLGVWLAVPIIVALTHALARVMAIDGTARPRFLLLFAAAAGWYGAALYVLVRVAFHCGLF